MKTYIERVEDGFIVVDKATAEYVTFSKRKNAETFRKFVTKFDGSIEERFNKYADGLVEIYAGYYPGTNGLDLFLLVERDLF